VWQGLVPCSFRGAGQRADAVYAPTATFRRARDAASGPYAHSRFPQRTPGAASGHTRLGAHRSDSTTPSCDGLGRVLAKEQLLALGDEAATNLLL